MTTESNGYRLKSGATNADGTTSLPMTRSRVQLPPAPFYLRRSSSAAERECFITLCRRFGPSSLLRFPPRFQQRPQPLPATAPRMGHARAALANLSRGAVAPRFFSGSACIARAGLISRLFPIPPNDFMIQRARRMRAYPGGECWRNYMVERRSRSHGIGRRGFEFRQPGPRDLVVAQQQKPFLRSGRHLQLTQTTEVFYGKETTNRRRVLSTNGAASVDGASRPKPRSNRAGESSTATRN